jgi:hypothetical protein
MPSQWHTSIKDKGHSHGISQTKKYSPGCPFELYVLKQGKIHEELGDTLQEAFPKYHQVAAAFAVKLEAILASVFPIAVPDKVLSFFLLPTTCP